MEFKELAVLFGGKGFLKTFKKFTMSQTDLYLGSFLKHLHVEFTRWEKITPTRVDDEEIEGLPKIEIEHSGLDTARYCFAQNQKGVYLTVEYTALKAEDNVFLVFFLPKFELEDGETLQELAEFLAAE